MKRFLHSRKIFSTLLNIIGMAIALGTFTALTIQVRYDWGYDNFPGAEHIYRMDLAEDDGNTIFSAHLSRPIIENIKGAAPEIKAVAAFQSSGLSKETVTLSKDGETYRFTIANSENSVTDVFPFEFIEGSSEDFSTSVDCIISENAARQLYGNGSPIGKSLWKGNSEKRVVAVYKDFPANSTVPEIIFNIGNSQLDDFSEWNMMCYMRLGEEGDTDRIRMSLLGKISSLYDIDMQSLSEEELESLKNSIKFRQIHEIYFDRTAEDGLPKGNRATTNTLFAVSLLIIIIAVINFINFSMASVPFSIKSINTRKVLGSSRTSLVARQIVDSLVMTLAAYVLSLVMLEILASTPLASYISGSLRPLDNPQTLLAGLAASVAAALLAGIYPALYSTSFQPALVLKGSFSLSAKGRLLRNVMTGFQYVMSFILASSALFIIVQIRYMKEYDMGFVSDQVIVAKPVSCTQEVFRQKMAENPQIKAVTFAGGQLVSDSKMGWGRSYNGERIQLDVLPVSTDFLDFFGLQISEGRGFSLSDEQSISGTFIMNESAMAKYPSLRIGARMSGHDGRNPAEIVGIVKDFNFQPMQYSIKPLALYNFGANPWWDLNYAYIRISPENVKETLQYIRDAVAELNPDMPSDYVTVEFLDENIGNMYQKEERLSNIIIAAALLSFVIALIGVLGLVYFETQFRKREIAVKKVYGATVKDILIMLNRRYIRLTLISFAVSVPLSYTVIRLWLRDFPYQAPVPIWIFAASLAATMLITVVTVTLRSHGAATANPVESIKNE